MNLLSKIQNKLKGEPVEKPTGSSHSIEDLNKLPDSEKLKVLDYLASVQTITSNSNE